MQVKLKDGHALTYDVLIIATGCRTAPEETQGMLGPKWRVNVHDFYTLDGARALRDKLDKFQGGRVVVHVNEMPIKCPVAPLEFTFLADTFFRERGIRDKVTLTYVTPLSGAFTKPKASKKLGHLLADKGIEAGHRLRGRAGRSGERQARLLRWSRGAVRFAGDHTDQHGRPGRASLGAWR
jgi:sulfide:quinone oxidoreductase